MKPSIEEVTAAGTRMRAAFYALEVDRENKILIDEFRKAQAEYKKLKKEYYEQ